MFRRGLNLFIKKLHLCRITILHWCCALLTAICTGCACLGVGSSMQTHHELDPEPKLLKNVQRKNELEAWENLLILRNKERVTNFEIPPCDELIRKFILQPPEEEVASTSSFPSTSSQEKVDDGNEHFQNMSP